jgi:hypothetical protein
MCHSLVLTVILLYKFLVAFVVRCVLCDPFFSDTKCTNLPAVCLPVGKEDTKNTKHKVSKQQRTNHWYFCELSMVQLLIVNNPTPHSLLAIHQSSYSFTFCHRSLLNARTCITFPLSSLINFNGNDCPLQKNSRFDFGTKFISFPSHSCLRVR